MTAWVLILAGCKSAPPKTTEQQLATAKAQIMAADYRADFAELQRLRDAAVPLAADPAWGYLARYWAGFASWRQAINGASHGMSKEELQAHLERAAADFDASLRLREDFADSHAAAAAVNGWLSQFHRDDTAALRKGIEVYKQHMARAKELDPGNPRVLWVEAIPYLVLPADKGGDRAHAIELYRRMVEASGPPVARSPLPDWGKPEGLMSLAYAHLSQPAPDLESAEKEARAALGLEPDWSYVKDVLLPQIETARASGAAATGH
jgi:hypothetical protein